MKASRKCVPSHSVTQGFIKTLGPSRGRAVPGWAQAAPGCERRAEVASQWDPWRGGTGPLLSQLRG